MHILIVANHYAVCSARYAVDAFTRLGHTVKHIGQPMGRNIWGMQVPEQYVWTPEPLFFGFDNDWIPDLIICMDSDPAMLEYVHEMHTLYWEHHYMKPPCIVWGVDNHVRDYRRPYFDHYFLAHKSVSVMDWHEWDEKWFEGEDWSDYIETPDMTHLPCCYDPVAFPPSPIAWEERRYDVCMIGVMYPKRWELVAAMRAAGLKVLAGTGLVYDAYRDAYHNSRVALVSSFNGDLPIRLFEGAGMGCAVLADDVRDLYALGDERRLHPIATYPSVARAVDNAKTLQGRSDKAQEAVEWASRHTFDARAQVIVNWLEARS